MVSHQHQLDVFGLRQDVSLYLQPEVRDKVHSENYWTHRKSAAAPAASHPVCVRGAVDRGDGAVRHPAASGAITLQRAGREQQVHSLFCISFPAPTPPSARRLVLLVATVVVVLRLQLKGQSGVQGNDAAAERKSHSCYLETEPPTFGNPLTVSDVCLCQVCEHLHV